MSASPSAASHQTRVTIAAITILLLVVSFLGTPVPGTNEPHYLSKARATADPTWCVNDFFLQSANAHAVFFAIAGPFATSLPFAVVLAGGRIISLLIVAIGLHSLCRAVGCDGRRAVISAALFYLIGLTGNFSGEWIIGGCESKVPAYGFAFLSLAACIRNQTNPTTGRYVIAGIFSGAAIALHPVVGMWTVIAISMTEVWLWLRPADSNTGGVKGVSSLLRRGITYCTTSIVFALPGLVPAFQMLLSSEVDLATKQEAKQIQVFYRLAHHLDPTRFPAFSWWHTAALIVILSLMVLWMQKRSVLTANALLDGGADGRPASINNANRYLLTFLGCTAIIAAVGIAIGWHDEPVMKLESRHWRAALLQFYPFRLFDAFLPLTTAIFLSAIPMARAGHHSANSVGTNQPESAPPVDRLSPFRSLITTATLAIILCGASAAAKRASSPSGFNAKLFAEWTQACEWLKNNTSDNAIIFAPRESFGLKLFAERAEYVCFKDCPQDAAGIVEWNRRLWTLHNWSKQSYEDEVFSGQELAALHQKTGIDYVLTRRLGPFSEQPIWEGKSWRIYPAVSGNSDVIAAPPVDSEIPGVSN